MAALTSGFAIYRSLGPQPRLGRDRLSRTLDDAECPFLGYWTERNARETRQRCVRIGADRERRCGDWRLTDFDASRVRESLETMRMFCYDYLNVCSWSMSVCAA